MTMPESKDVKKQALCPICRQLLDFATVANFNRHVLHRCTGPPPEQPNLLCVTCQVRFKDTRSFNSHICQRNQPSDTGAKYTLQQADGMLQNILRKADEHEIYQLCFSQVLLNNALSSMY